MKNAKSEGSASKRGRGRPRKNAAKNIRNATKGSSTDAVAMLKADHRKVEELFKQFEKAEEPEKRELALHICSELITHTLLEEELFYPACREQGVEDDILDEAQVEHDGAKTLITELLSQEPDEPFYDAKVAVLAEYIKHHVGEEEKPRSGIFASAQKAGIDMSVLGQRLQARKKEIQAREEAEGLSPPRPHSLRSAQYNRKEYDMPRQSNDRDRDEQGRFMSDDDDDYGNGRSRGRSASSGRGGSSNRDRDEQGRFMSDDDDGRSRGRSASSGRGGSNYRDRDEQGRFASDDDDDDYRSSRSRSSRSRDDDEDGRGWYGDSEGHSEAARRGWEERGSSSRSRGSSYDDDDDDRGRSSGRGRSQSRSRDDDRSQGGWFGDSEGHSEAARRGWEERGSSSRSRSRDDDDDNRGRSSGGRGRSQSQSRSRSRDDDQGHGGWFGDPRGHAEAARRGWQNRD
jgi:hemerythrin superfamily protein